MEQEKKSVFEVLSAVNCNLHTEKKGGLTYLSWPWAWHEVKIRYPNANYGVCEDEHGRPYFSDGHTCWVKVFVTIEGITHTEYLPIMDARNNSIPADKVTSFDMNKAIQRALTKACARHGLGLYIYAGEDLPEDSAEPEKKAAAKPAPKKQAAAKKTTITDKTIKQVVDWVCAVPEGEQRDARIKKAESAYEWPGNLLEAFRAMVDLTA
jgi:hypothetical protein